MVNNKPYFPLFMDLSDKKIVVIGAGQIASRRTKVLSHFTKRITVVAIKVSAEIKALAKSGDIILHEKAYEQEDILGADIVIAATNDDQLNNKIYDVCKNINILVNVASDKHKCDFHFPGIVKNDQLVIGVNAGGVNHQKVKKVRRDIEQFLNDREEHYD